MSSQLVIAAAASTLAMAAFAINAAPGHHGIGQNGASMAPAFAGLPAPSVLTR